MPRTRKAESTEIVNWEERLAAMAVKAAEQEKTEVIGNFFSLAAGQLSYAGSPIKDNTMEVIILEAVLHNVYYDKPFQSGDPQAPRCFAFGTNAETMKPHKVVVEAGQAESELCHDCPMNQWGTALNGGNGKACTNSRRLAMIPAGAEDIKNAEVGYMKLPVMSVKNFSAYTTQIVNSLRVPLFGVTTQVSVVPDMRSQFKVTFELVNRVSADKLGDVFARHEEVAKTIDFPYQLELEEKPKPKRNRKF